MRNKKGFLKISAYVKLLIDLNKIMLKQIYTKRFEQLVLDINMWHVKGKEITIKEKVCLHAKG